MRQPITGSKPKMPRNKVIKPNGDIKILMGVGREKDGSITSEYKYFEFPKSAGKKALEKKQQTKMKKATSSMKAKKKK